MQPLRLVEATLGMQPPGMQPLRLVEATLGMQPLRPVEATLGMPSMLASRCERLHKTRDEPANGAETAAKTAWLMVSRGRPPRAQFRQGARHSSKGRSGRNERGRWMGDTSE